MYFSENDRIAGINTVFIPRMNMDYGSAFVVTVIG